MAHRAAKNLLSKLTEAPGAGSQQICMPQDTLYILDSALVTIEDNIWLIIGIVSVVVAVLVGFVWFRRRAY